MERGTHPNQFGSYFSVSIGPGFLGKVAQVTQRVHVPNNWVLGFWVVVIMVQVLGKYMTIGYLDP